MESQHQKALISVIVAVYNQEVYVRKCLDSICNQTYRKLEIIVVNDGSTDRSLDIINEYCENDKRVIVITKNNEGLAYARRDGIMVAKGEFIVFVDSDDYLLKSAVKDLYECAEKFQVDTVIGSYYRKFGPIIKKADRNFELPISTIIEGDNLFSQYYISFFGINILPTTLCGRIYRKSVIDNAMQHESLYHQCCYQMGEDEYFNLMLFPYLKSIYIIDKVVFVYRYGGMTSKYNKYLSGLFDFGDLRIKLLDRYDYAKGYNPLFVEYKNILYSELLQRVQYLKQDKNTLIDYIKEELEGRYLVRRMIEYYDRNDCPEYVKPIVEKDYEKIYAYTQKLVQTNKIKFRVKKILSYMMDILKFF